MAIIFFTCVMILQLLVAPNVKAVEVLSVQELALHCERLSSDPEGVDGQFCIRYLQGFIDGAVATDARVALDVESATGKDETFTERAIRTRVLGGSGRSRSASLAEFCLGDPLPLRNVVNVVAADLANLSDGTRNLGPAMDVVYASLQHHYPCEPR